MTFSNL